MLAFLVIAIAAMVAAFALRIIIFNTMDDDRVAAELLDSTFPTTNDMLCWHLWRVRKKVASQHRWKVDTYFWLNIAAVAALLLAFAVDRL